MEIVAQKLYDLNVNIFINIPICREGASGLYFSMCTLLAKKGDREEKTTKEQK